MVKLISVSFSKESVEKLTAAMELKFIYYPNNL
jgi:hypothetical protein